MWKESLLTCSLTPESKIKWWPDGLSLTFPSPWLPTRITIVIHHLNKNLLLATDTLDSFSFTLNWKVPKEVKVEYERKINVWWADATGLHIRLQCDSLFQVTSVPFILLIVVRRRPDKLCSEQTANTSIKGEKRVPSISQEPIHANEKCDMSNKHKKPRKIRRLHWYNELHSCYSSSSLMGFWIILYHPESVASKCNIDFISWHGQTKCSL